MSACSRKQIDPCLLPCTKLKFNWRNIKADRWNWKEQKGGSSLEYIGTGNNFLDRIPIVQPLRSTISNWDLMKLISCKAKDTVSRTKWQLTDWKKVFSNPSSDRGLISEIYKEIRKLDTHNLCSPIENLVQR